MDFKLTHYQTVRASGRPSYNCGYCMFWTAGRL